MWKKITAFLGLLLLGIILVAYYQFSQQEQYLRANLAQQGISFDTVDIQLLPQPQASFTGLGYSFNGHQVVFDHAQAEFHWLPLLRGKLLFKQVDLAQGEWKSLDSAQLEWKNIHLIIKPKQLELNQIGDLAQQWREQQLPSSYSDSWDFHIDGTADNLQGNSFQLGVDFDLRQQSLVIRQGNLRLKSAQYEDWRKEQHIQLGKTDIVWHSHGADFTFSNVQINQQTFSTIKGNLQLIEQGISLVFQTCADCIASVHLKTLSPIIKQLYFQGHKIPFAEWQKALNVPVILTGNGEVEATATLEDNHLSQIETAFQVQNGVLKGMNILNIVGRYLPINFDAQQDIDTEFQGIQGHVEWNKLSNQLQLSGLSLLTPQLRVQAQGNADVSKMKCDFQLQIGVNKQGYEDFSLPIRLFDNCQSPQYQFQIDKNFRHQLKNLLKQKFG